MMTFRKLAAGSTGRLIRAYFTENKPEADPEAQPVSGPALDSGGRLTSYYKVRARLRAEADRKALRSQLGALDEALARNGQAVTALGQEIEAFLRTMCNQTADLARRGIEAAELRQARKEAAARPTFSPSPY